MNTTDNDISQELEETCINCNYFFVKFGALVQRRRQAYGGRWF